MKPAMHLIDTFSYYQSESVEALRRHNQCLTTIKLLCQLTRAVQQHRGATMGYLSGATSFHEKITALQASVEKILLLLNHTEGDQIFNPYKNHLSHISNDWKTIIIGWQDDKVLHNFEFHSHLVNALLKFLRNYIKKQLLPHLNSSGVDYNPLLDVCFIQLPNNIESLAIVRGLSTNAAVVKACGQDSHAKLSYLLKDIPLKNKQLIEKTSHLIPEMTIIKDQNIQLHKFLLSIQMSILDSREITANSETLFALSTDIINAHWSAIEQGIQKIDKLSFHALIQ